MTIHHLRDCPQRVFGLQSVVAVVNVCRVLEDQTALQIVLVGVRLGSDVIVQKNLLVLMEPAQLGLGVTPNGELDTSIMAFFRFGQSQDDRRNCSEEKKKDLV